METELELTFSLQVPAVAWSPLLPYLAFFSKHILRLSEKGTASVKGPTVVGWLLHCSRDCFAGHWDSEDDG